MGRVSILKPQTWSRSSAFKFLIPTLGVLSLYFIYEEYQKQILPKGSKSYTTSRPSTVYNNTIYNTSSTTVEAWYNPITNRWETPAPWDPLYKKTVTKNPTKQMDRKHVFDSNQSR
jgi:hypothetical protein